VVGAVAVLQMELEMVVLVELVVVARVEVQIIPTKELLEPQTQEVEGVAHVITQLLVQAVAVS
jgi:hypothetical protein